MKFSLLLLSSIPFAVSGLYDQCVTLIQYGPDCKGEPITTMAFATSTSKGSPCYSDASMEGYAVKNQFCREDFFQQDVYMGDTCNDNDDGTSFSTQVFTKDSCLHGYKFGGCVPGPCPSQQEGKEPVDESDSDKEPRQDGSTASPPLYNQCVTLIQYGPDCKGEPITTMAFPTSTSKGSPCYSDASMVGYAVKNQFCREDFFQQDVYMGDTCNDDDGTTQVFTKDSCLHGYKFGGCVPGPCAGVYTTTLATAAQTITSWLVRSWQTIAATCGLDDD